MNQFYTVAITSLTILFFAGCSKDSFKKYEDRIVGTWIIDDVDRQGIGSGNASLPFREGRFTFEEGGGMVYVNNTGIQYQGSWDIDRRTVNTGCQDTGNGVVNCSQTTNQVLFITAIDFAGQEVRSETFDDIDFKSSNRFKAYVSFGFYRYAYDFRRQ
jgi:hypothetical protein